MIRLGPSAAGNPFHSYLVCVSARALQVMRRVSLRPPPTSVRIGRDRAMADAAIAGKRAASPITQDPEEDGSSWSDTAASPPVGSSGPAGRRGASRRSSWQRRKRQKVSGNSGGSGTGAASMLHGAG